MPVQATVSDNSFYNSPNAVPVHADQFIHFSSGFGSALTIEVLEFAVQGRTLVLMS